MTDDRSDGLPLAWRAAIGPDGVRHLDQVTGWVAEQERDGRTILPPAADRFRAFELTPPDAVKVVILGQDPYHGRGQAHGLAFSVARGVRTPPSLVNVFREMESDLGLPKSGHGLLDHWARQGVLLLNVALTVEQAKAGSHLKKGWRAFSDAVVAAVSRGEPSVFMLWGNSARERTALIDADRHLVLATSHPSPLWGSASKGFFGSRPFSQANAFLERQGRGAIDWALPA